MGSSIKIGLLGGSFNPAHEGHLHISEIARKKLGLDQVWWLVSPQNPLKEKSGMMPFEERFESARKIAGSNPKIIISDIESRLNTIYTSDTLKRLKQKYPRHKFFWLMGTDNLIQLPKWKNWEEIFEYAEVHVFDRANASYGAIKGKATSRKKIHYHHIRRNPLSSTVLRSSV